MLGLQQLEKKQHRNNSKENVQGKGIIENYDTTQIDRL